MRTGQFLLASIFFLLAYHQSSAQKLTEIVRSKADGLLSEEGIMRRDPSDVIKVGENYYLWYSKRYLKDGVNLYPGDHNASNGYHADIWYATSKDGKSWDEKGVSVAKGGEGEWDEQSAFTPNILVWKEKYYLYYTGVPKPFTNKGNQVTKSCIGVAVSDSPDGPWRKIEKPVITCSNDVNEFDSMRVDDACLIVREGEIYLYYKGRQWDNTPGNTKMGVAISNNPTYGFSKNPSNPLVQGGHEVMIWPLNSGVVAFINIGSPDVRKTLQYANDGIRFSTMGHNEDVPVAAGYYRPEAFTDSNKGEMPQWGIEIVKKNENSLPGLGRFDLQWDN